MRIFTANSLRDASFIPWRCWDDTEQTRTRDEVWGETLVPTPKYDSYDENGFGVGEPIYYQWTALLEPEYALPDWITEITE